MVQRSFRMLQQLRAVRNDVLPAVCYRREKRREERGKLYQVRHLLRAWLRRSLVDDENPRTDQSGQRNRWDLHEWFAYDHVLWTVRPHSGSPGMGRAGLHFDGTWIGRQLCWDVTVYLLKWNDRLLSSLTISGSAYCNICPLECRQRSRVLIWRPLFKCI